MDRVAIGSTEHVRQLGRTGIASMRAHAGVATLGHLLRVTLVQGQKNQRMQFIGMNRFCFYMGACRSGRTRYQPRVKAGNMIPCFFTGAGGGGG